MEINISKSVHKSIPDYCLGIIKCYASVGSGSEDLWQNIESLTDTIKNEYELDQVNSYKGIPFARRAYKHMGKDPSRYRPSADSLVRRIVKGNQLYKVNNIVDILNYISIKSGISIGGYDFQKITGPIYFDKGTADEEYFGIGRGKINIENLPVLKDEKGVFGSPTSDSERTMINELSEEILFIFFDFGKDEQLENYMEQAKILLTRHCNANDFQIKRIDS